MKTAVFNNDMAIARHFGGHCYGHGQIQPLHTPILISLKYVTHCFFVAVALHHNGTCTQSHHGTAHRCLLLP